MERRMMDDGLSRPGSLFSVQGAADDGEEGKT
jgi:hypothetical protein